jgi:streptomycin 6-kinase
MSMTHPSDLLARYTAHWRLQREGAPFYTASSALQPVRWRGRPAMLKIALNEEETRGNRLMAWWNGRGTASVFGQHGMALLMERLGPALTAQTTAESDEASTSILCHTAAVLHGEGSGPLPALEPLSTWFHDLLNVQGQYGVAISQAAMLAEELLAAPRDEGPLHGDLHHGNILHASARGWAAIDPKGLWGERAFDYANLFCNPNFETVALPGRFERLLARVQQEARLDPRRLLCWIAAWAGLSVIWHGQSNGDDRAARFVLGAALDTLARQ